MAIARTRQPHAFPSTFIEIRPDFYDYAPDRHVPDATTWHVNFADPRGRHRKLVLHAGDAAGAEEAAWGIDVADSIAARCKNPTTLDQLVGRAVLLDYRWGESDGN